VRTISASAEQGQQRTRRIRLLLADAHRSFVEALGMRLDGEIGMRVVAGTVRPQDAVRVVRTHPVDVAVLGVDGAATEFLDCADELLAARADVRLVAVAADGQDVAALAEAVRRGFRGWVPKDAGVADLIDVVRGVHRGETRIPPLLLTRLLDRLMTEQEQRRAAELPLASLTVRERQVLEAMMRGLGRDQIAAQLTISPNTVRTHMQNVLGKLEVHSSVAAVALARRAGMR
jgi:DNA-binding NarL/FixJ family response regulator